MNKKQRPLFVREWLAKNSHLWDHKNPWSIKEVEELVPAVREAGLYAPTTGKKVIKLTLWHQIGLLQGRNVIR